MIESKKWIITKNPDYFKKIGDYNYCDISVLKDLPKTVCCDSETDSLDAKTGSMFCVQIGTYTDAYIIDLQDYSNQTIEFKEYKDLSYTFEDLIPYLEDKTLIFQNGLFDLGFFYQKGFFPNKIKDTYIASKLIYNGYPPNYRHGLGDIFQRELGVTLNKHEQANISKVKLSQPSTIEYSFLDVTRLLELHDALEVKIKELKLELTYEINCNFVLACAYMEQCGMPLSAELWKAKMAEDEKLVKEKSLEIIEYIYDKFPKYRDNQLSFFDTEKKLKLNLSSSQQMIPVFEELGINIEVDDKNEKGKKKKSIEVDVIKKSNHEFVKLWLDFKHYLHDVTTFGDNFLNKIHEGRIYSRFNTIVDTGRLSSRGSGELNLLNIPAKKSTRAAFKANKGYVMVVADYEGQFLKR